jgi:hypothetical protein
MSEAIFVEVAVASPAGCPVANASATADTQASNVSRTSLASSGDVTEEFSLGADALPADAPATEMGSDGERSLYRFSRTSGANCVCETVERVAGPAADIHATGGTFTVAFHVTDLDAVQTVVADLKDAFGGVRVRQFRHAVAGETADTVVDDRGRLTDR